MFLNNQNVDSVDEYVRLLKLIGQLSYLFSDSKTPYLYYRIAEKIFCKAFNADDLSRSDVSADAAKNGLGVGLKTFLEGNKKTFQKIAEFNSDKNLYSNLPPEQIPFKIAELRNKRIELTHSLFDIENSIYHSIIRRDGLFGIYEEPMSLINTDNIGDIKVKDTSIVFNDGLNDYSFLLSKSTLTKRFVAKSPILEFNVNILENPLLVLEKCLKEELKINFQNTQNVYIFLPLYGRNKTVFERSGLNQWNAKGRVRDINEIYIPIPANIHKYLPDFFPPRDVPFDLVLPDKKILKSKVCQDNSKALMSYSNKELGKWLLRKILKLNEGEILTYEKLQIVGIDAVRIDKISIEKYEINFAACGSYEKFIEDCKNV